MVQNLAVQDYGSSQVKFTWNPPNGGDDVVQYNYGGYWWGSYGGFSGSTTQLYVIINKNDGGVFRVRTICVGFDCTSDLAEINF